VAAFNPAEETLPEERFGVQVRIARWLKAELNEDR